MQKTILLSTLLVFGACQTEEKADPLSLCENPVAASGADQTIALGQMVTLSASASTWCEGRLSSSGAHHYELLTQLH